MARRRKTLRRLPDPKPLIQSLCRAGVPAPLTPSLSPRERENRTPSCDKSERSEFMPPQATGLPLLGERDGVRGNGSYSKRDLLTAFRRFCWLRLKMFVPDFDQTVGHAIKLVFHRQIMSASGIQEVRRSFTLLAAVAPAR